MKKKSPSKEITLLDMFAAFVATGILQHKNMMYNPEEVARASYGIAQQLCAEKDRLESINDEERHFEN